MKPHIRVGIFVVAAIVLGAGLYSLTAHTVRPIEIPAASIPSEIRQSVADKRDVRWYVLEQKDNSYWAALTCTVDTPDGQPVRECWFPVRLPTYSGLLVCEYKDELFTGQVGYGLSDNQGRAVYTIDACGLARDSRMTVVRGTTSTGRVVTAAPQNGFWILIVGDSTFNERWTEIAALDSRGRRISSLMLPRSPR